MTEESQAPESDAAPVVEEGAEAPANDRPSLEQIAESVKARREARKESAEKPADAEGKEEDDAGEPEAQPAKPASQEKPKKEKEWIHRKEHDREAEKRAAAEARADEQARLLEDSKKHNAVMADLIKEMLGGKTADPAPNEDDDILDTALDKKTSKEIAEIKQTMAAQDFTSAMNQAKAIGEAADAEFDKAADFVVTMRAKDIIDREAAKGKQIKVEDAWAKAASLVGRELHEIYVESGKKPSAIVAYIANQSQFMKRSGALAKKGGEQPTVNMEAVKKAREEAGAPTMKSESVQTSGGSSKDRIAAKLNEKYGKGGLDRLKSFGMA